MFAKEPFPLHQGDLDSLCMVYAVLNSLHQINELLCTLDAESKFKDIIHAIAKDGKLGSALTLGIDPFEKDSDASNVNWVAEIVLRRQFLGPKIDITSNNISTVIKNSRAGAILYFTYGEDDDRSHYTFVKKGNKSSGFDLWDSYGFKELLLKNKNACIDNESVNLIFAWPTLSL
jgi:hypothetical protein